MDSIAATQPGITELLKQAGARPRGHRHDCPKCGGSRTVTHSDEAFFCHKCQWKGNTVTLAKELGIYQRIPSAEYREQCRAHEAAARLYHAVHIRQLELREDLRTLGRLEQAAHDAGDTERSWETLALVYRSEPEIHAELNFLESSNAADVTPWPKCCSLAS